MNTFPEIQDDIAAIATPPGKGALGIIRVSGHGAIEKVNRVFKGDDLTLSKGFTLHYGFIRNDQEVLDEVLLSVFKSPKSFTGEDVIEISCHGSSYILNQVMQLLLSMGIRLAKPGEFTQRAFLNGKLDLTQAEAVADLIASDSEASHRMAMQQMKGGFKKRIDELRKKLIDFASLIELELDFGEEDVEFADRSRLRNLVEEVLHVIQELISSFKFGNVFKHGVYTVIAGRPNAGKSTLLNALLNEERAIVSEIAGTTRDTIEEVLNIHGLMFRLVDTAGIREATDQIEAIGVERTMASIDKSSVLVYVYDAVNLSKEELDYDLQLLTKPGMPCLVLANKSDLLPKTSMNSLKGISISAKDNHATEEVKEALFSLAMSNQNSHADVVVSNLRHVEALSQAKFALDRVLAGLSNGLTGDLLSFELREALYHLGLITGEVTTDDLLENIFRNFCIGK